VLTLWLDAPDTAPLDALRGVGAVFLESALGEQDAVTGIKSIDLRVGVSALAQPFAEFRDAFDAAKGKAGLVGESETIVSNNSSVSRA
jgi:hypothetical protein